MVEHKKSNLRSEEVQEIMSRPPNWMIRWGITLIFILIVLVIFISWFIKYPDVIAGSATLTTTSPPVKLIVKTPGEVDNIFVLDNKKVLANQCIISIKSNLSLEARDFLLAEIPKIKAQLLESKLQNYISEKPNLIFGEIEANFSALSTAINNYRTLILDNNLAFNIGNTNKQINNQKALYNLSVKQLGNLQKLVANADSKFNSDKILFDKGVLSQSEFFERERNHKMTISDLQNLEKTKIQTAITITDLEKQLHEMKFDFENQKRTLLQEINSNISAIENALSAWKQSYQIIAPISGKVSYLQSISKNEFLEQGKALIAIIPNNEAYIAHLKIPKTGFGKVKKGQKVMLKIDNFPYYEYGQLVGRVEDISLIPNEDGYLVKVKLLNGLRSTYKKDFKFSPEMTGSAEIITEDLRVFQRVFNTFKKIFE